MRIWAAFGSILVITNLVSTHSALAQSCVKAPLGLIAWWPLDNSPNDIAGTNNPPSSGAAINYVPGKVGAGVDINLTPLGISILKTPNLNPLGSDFSVDAWVMITKPPAGQWRTIFLNYAGVGYYILYITDQNKAAIGFRLGVAITGTDKEPIVEAIGTTTLNAGQWYHLVGVRSGATATQAGTTASIYVNGKLDATVTKPALLLHNQGSINTSGCSYARIGAHHTSAGHCTSPTANSADPHSFHGVIDEVEIFNRALSPSEIQALYAAGAAGKCKPSGPAKGMTWRPGGVNATTGTVTVGCGPSEPRPCNASVGDQLCTDSLPLLCFKPSPLLPKPKSVVETPYYIMWSGGIVGTTAPMAPAAAPIISSLTNANKRCADEFGAGWRLAEFHDGGRGVRTAAGWNFQAYGNVGDSKSRFWLHIDDQPKGTCFTRK